MRNHLIYCLLLTSLLIGCTGKKNAQQAASAPAKPTVAKLTYPDSVERAITSFDNRLDIKMKRKFYAPTPGDVVTLQKWFEYGDTTRLVKLRAETITGRTKLVVTQFHFINQKLAAIHEYTYNKRCQSDTSQCISEAKYYVKNDTLFTALKRNKSGTLHHPPVIEGASFAAFTPTPATLQRQQAQLAAIYKKYAALPYPKPRT